MALTIPSYPDPRDPANPVDNAYGWLSGLTLDLRAGSGRVLLSVHPRADAWQGQPIAVLPTDLGQPFGEGARFPGLAELMADPEFAAAYEVIGAKLYAALAATRPDLAGSTQA